MTSLLKKDNLSCTASYLKTSEREFLYYESISFPESPFCIIFSHGLMSNLNGKKAMHIEKHCFSKKYNFVKYDNFGHGKSSGEFIEQTITSWHRGLQIIIENFAKTKKVILVGSSMGGWISLLTATKMLRDNLAGLLLIAPAPDFTEDLFWKNLSEKEKLSLQNGDIINVKNNCSDDIEYLISYNLVNDGRKNLLLTKDFIKINCPTILIHGTKDTTVPPSISQKIAEKLTSEKVVLQYIKNSAHNLSNEYDLQIISNSLEMLVN